MRTPVTDGELLELAEVLTTAPDTEIGHLYDKVAAMMNSSPDEPRLRFLFGSICNRARQYGIAKAIFEPMIRTHGNWGALRVNYGMTLDYLGDWDYALHHYRHAEADKKLDRTNLYTNRASVLLKMGRYEEADREADKAIAYNPKFKEPFITKGFARMAMGDLEIGWDNYDMAVGSINRITIDYGVPRWKGEKGARLIVHGEQGIGDEIMYASCLPDAMAVCEAVAVDCDPKLSKFLRRSFPSATVVGSRRATERPWVADFKPTHSIGIGSLPVLYRRKQESFTGEPYLKADQAFRAMYYALVVETAVQRENNPSGVLEEIIGLCWSGGGPETKEKEREIPLEAFRPLIDKHPRAAFVSLQYRDEKLTRAQIDETGLPIQHHNFATGQGASYEHTAAMIAACDRVVGTDTTAIHAAGAMGVKTDCLLSTPCMWVWGPWQKDQAAWYKSVKLHRMPAKSNWTDHIRHLVSQGQL